MKRFIIEKQRLEYLLSNYLGGTVAILVIASVLMGALQGQVNDFLLLIWGVSVIIVVLLRILLVMKYKKEGVNTQNYNVLYRTLLSLTTIHAIMLGSSAIFIFPQDLENQMILVLFIFGLTTGAAITFASLPRYYFVYSGLTLTPFLYRFLIETESASFIFAIAITLFGITMAFVAQKAGQMVNSNIKLGHHNETLLKDLEEKVEELNIASKAKSEFLSIMSHEIRTPLNAILGFIQILKNNEKDATKFGYMQTIEKSSKSLMGIINDILDLSKIEAGKLTLENVECNPKAEFTSLLELYEKNAQELGIIVKNSIADDLPSTIKCDILRLKQVVSNLLSNALKFTSSGSTVEFIVRYSRENSSLYIEVKDEGIGIAPEKIAVITEAFTQADTSTSREYGGTGLGLAIITNILNLYSSKLDIKSELGSGSSFSFEIKAEAVEVELNEEEETNVLIDFTDKKVLVAEDNKTNQMFIEIVLDEYNLDITMVENGQEAVEAFQSQSFDIVLMDINMPIQNGTEAMHAIKAYEKENNSPTLTPIIALTANALGGDSENYIQEGFDGYLSKPIEIPELQKVLQHFLE